MRHNTITGSLWGITVINAADVNLGTEDDWGHNEIHDNGNSGEVYDLYNNSTYDIMAVGNDWGTVNEREIERHIVHQFDNPSLGLVTYIPFIGDDAIEETESTSIQISPNPVSNGNFVLTLEKALPAEVTLYNIRGQRVKSQHVDSTTQTLDVASLKCGVYFVEVQNESGKRSRK